MEEPCIKAYYDKLAALGKDINEIIQDGVFEDFATKRGIAKENWPFLAGVLLSFVHQENQHLLARFA